MSAGMKVLFAVSTLVGLIVGAGIFGLPYVVAQTGYLVGAFYLIFFGGVVMLLHLCYGEIVLRTPEKHRLVGYAALYLGRWAKPVLLASSIVTLEGALLAYVILGGEFLQRLAGPIFGGGLGTWTLIFFAAGALVIWRNIRLIGWLEFILDALFIGALTALALVALPALRFGALVVWRIDAPGIFAPFGVVLFALSGWAAVPELRDLLPKNGRGLKRAIVIGSLVSVLLYLLFVFAVVGVSGQRTSPEALSGLAPYLGTPIVLIGSFFGLLTIATSLFVMGLGAKQMLRYDFNVPPVLAWLLTVLPVLAAYLLGLKNFIGVIGTVGVIGALVEGSTIFLTYLRARRDGTQRPEYALNLPAPLVYALISLFVLGAAAHFIFL